MATAQETKVKTVESTEGSSETESKLILERARQIENELAQQQQPISMQLSQLDTNGTDKDATATSQITLTPSTMEQYPLWKLPSGKCLYDLQPVEPSIDLVINERVEPTVILKPDVKSHAQFVAQVCNDSQIDLQPLHVAILSGRVCVARKTKPGRFQLLDAPKLKPYEMDPATRSDYESLISFSPSAHKKQVTFQGDILPATPRPPPLRFTQQEDANLRQWIDNLEDQDEEYVDVIQEWLNKLDALKKEEDPTGVVTMTMLDIARLPFKTIQSLQTYIERVFKLMEAARKEVNAVTGEEGVDDQATPLLAQAQTTIEQYSAVYHQVSTLLALRRSIELLAAQQQHTERLLQIQANRLPSEEAGDYLTSIEDQMLQLRLKELTDRLKVERQKKDELAAAKQSQLPSPADSSTTPKSARLPPATEPRAPPRRHLSAQQSAISTLDMTETEEVPTSPQDIHPPTPSFLQESEYESVFQKKPHRATSTPSADADTTPVDMELTGPDISTIPAASEWQHQQQRLVQAVQDSYAETQRAQSEAEAAKMLVRQKDEQLRQLRSDFLKAQEEKDTQLNLLKEQKRQLQQDLTASADDTQNLLVQCDAQIKKIAELKKAAENKKREMAEHAAVTKRHHEESRLREEKAREEVKILHRSMRQLVDANQQLISGKEFQEDQETTPEPHSGSSSWDPSNPLISSPSLTSSKEASREMTSERLQKVENAQEPGSDDTRPKERAYTQTADKTPPRQDPKGRQQPAVLQIPRRNQGPDEGDQPDPERPSQPGFTQPDTPQLERTGYLMMITQRWFHNLSVSVQLQLRTLLDLCCRPAPQRVKSERYINYLRYLSERFPAARSWATHETYRRPLGLVEALAGLSFQVDPNTVGIPRGVPPSRRNPEFYVTIAGPKTNGEEERDWLGGLCLTCNRMMIDGTCVALCVLRPPACDNCSLVGHFTSQCLTTLTSTASTPKTRPTVRPFFPTDQSTIGADNITPILTHTTRPQYENPPPLVDKTLDDDDEPLFIPSRSGTLPRRTTLTPDEKLMRNLETSRQLSDSIRESSKTPEQDILKLCALSFDNISQMSAIHLSKDVLEKVPMFDGSNRENFFSWIDDVERTAHHTGMSPLRVARMRSAKQVYTTLNGIPQDHDWRTTKLILQQYYSNTPTTGHAMIELFALRQKATEHIRDYCQQFALLNRAACGKGPKEDNSQQSKLTFLRSLYNPKIVTEVCKRGEDLPKTLYEVMELACEVHKRFQFIEGVKGATMMNFTLQEPKSLTHQIAAIQPANTPATIPGTVVCSICGGPHTSAICSSTQVHADTMTPTATQKKATNPSQPRRNTWQQRRPTGTITQNISTEVPLTSEVWSGLQKTVDQAVADALQKELDKRKRWTDWNNSKKATQPPKNQSARPPPKKNPAPAKSSFKDKTTKTTGSTKTRPQTRSQTSARVQQIVEENTEDAGDVFSDDSGAEEALADQDEDEFSLLQIETEIDEDSDQ